MPEKPTDPKTETAAPEVHTELRRLGEAPPKETGAKTGAAPASGLDLVPELPDDQLDDLFNDMPV